jgi:hypothetical protein
MLGVRQIACVEREHYRLSVLPMLGDGCGKAAISMRFRIPK